jgi:superfamily II DNA or RNA helicase
MVRIEITDAIHSSVNVGDGMQIRDALSYPAAFWRSKTVGMSKKTGRAIKRKVRVDYTKDAFCLKQDGRWFFYTGLIPRVKEYCKESNIRCDVYSLQESYIGSYPPMLHGIELREDQIELVSDACNKHRGVIQAPTGTGKTILQMAIRSAFRMNRCLILAHTTSIVKQTFAELLKFGFKNPQMIGAGESYEKGLYGDTVVSTMQSFVKLEPSVYEDYFEAVIVDEAHHVTRPNGTYARILSRMLSPIRLGFTATLPTSQEAILTMEGLLGPVIGKQTIQEAAELDILAKPRIKLLKSAYSNRVHDIRKYADVYNAGIVENRQRNRMIAECVKDYVDSGKTVLILVTRLDHGDFLRNILEEHYEVKTEFVEGKTDTIVREQIKTALIEKKQKCVIATAVWREGINIPSLDVVINACGGKSEIMTLQAIGRGLRKTDDKDEVIVVDIFDPSHHYLISHFGQRITLYMNQGWM